GDDIRLGEGAAARAELGFEVLPETQVQIDGAVPRTVERADGGGRGAAGGAGGAAEDDGLGRRVLLAVPGEEAGPEGPEPRSSRIWPESSWASSSNRISRSSLTNRHET